MYQRHKGVDQLPGDCNSLGENGSGWSHSGSRTGNRHGKDEGKGIRVLILRE